MNVIYKNINIYLVIVGLDYIGWKLEFVVIVKLMNVDIYIIWMGMFKNEFKWSVIKVVNVFILFFY